MYDESYARLPRSNATTTNEYHTVSYIPPAPPLPPFMQTSVEPKECSLSNVLFPESSCEDTQTPEMKLAEQRRKTDDKISRMRRIQSDGNMLSVNPQSIDENCFKKKSKSMMENLCTIPDEVQQESNAATVETNQPIAETPVESCSAIDLPIDDWRPILQILENVFAEEELRSSEQLSEKPESLEPLLSNKGSYLSDLHHHSCKSIEQRNKNESHLSTRFRRSNSNQGGRRRRTATRRATCTFLGEVALMLFSFLLLLSAVDQQQPYLNDEASKTQPRLSSSYRQATTVLKGKVPIHGWWPMSDVFVV